MQRAVVSLILVSALLLSAAPAVAHHAFATEFDAEKQVMKKGIVNIGRKYSLRIQPVALCSLFTICRMGNCPKREKSLKNFCAAERMIQKFG